MSRLLSELLLLQRRGRLTAEQIAAELAVSVRTVYRDVRALQEAGVPVYAGSGHGGGFRLVDGYRTRLTGLSRAEVQALFLAGLPGQAAELGLGAVLTAAELKLSASLPPELADGADRLRRRFLLDAPGWYYDGDEVPHLSELAAAVWEGFAVEVTYRRWRQPTDVTRRLRPLGIVLKSGKWYLVARPADAVEPRTYRVGKIIELTVLPERHEVPGDFDLADWWHRQVAGFRARLVQGRATVRFSPAAMTRLPDLVDAETRRAVLAGIEDADGWRRANIPIESLTHAESELLRFGAEVEVLAPPALRARFRDTTRRLCDTYHPPPAPASPH